MNNSTLCENLKHRVKTSLFFLAIAYGVSAHISSQAQSTSLKTVPTQSTQSTQSNNLTKVSEKIIEPKSTGSFEKSDVFDEFGAFGGVPNQGKTRAADYYSKKLILKVAIPSKSFSDSGNHIYKPFFERQFISSVCEGGNLKCEVKEYDNDPREPEKFGTLRKIDDNRLPSGIDILVWGSDIRLNKRADDSLFSTNMNIFFEDGDISKIKKKYMRVNSPWIKPLTVGAKRGTANKAREICKKIKAKCTFIVSEDFDVIYDKFKVNKIDLIISDSWMFENKDLEDRILQTMPEQIDDGE